VAGDIADGVDAGVGGLELVVGEDEAVFGEFYLSLVEVDGFEIGVMADGDDYGIEGGGGREVIFGTGERDVEVFIGNAGGGNGGFESNVVQIDLQALMEGAGEVGVGLGEE